MRSGTGMDKLLFERREATGNTDEESEVSVLFQLIKESNEGITDSDVIDGKFKQWYRDNHNSG